MADKPHVSRSEVQRRLRVGETHKQVAKALGCTTKTVQRVARELRNSPPPPQVDKIGVGAVDKIRPPPGYAFHGDYSDDGEPLFALLPTPPNPLYSPRTQTLSISHVSNVVYEEGYELLPTLAPPQSPIESSSLPPDPSRPF